MNPETQRVQLFLGSLRGPQQLLTPRAASDIREL